MNVSRQPKLGRLWLGVPLGLALLALAWGMSGSAQADDSGFRMALNARGDGVSCDAASEPSECTVPLAGQFTLAVEIIDVPSEGYIGLSTQVDFHGLTWVPRATADENVWPDNGFPLRSPDAPGLHTQLVAHGGLTSTSPPLPVSEFEGSVVEITLACTEEESSAEVALINLDPAVNPLGSSINLPDETQVPGKTVGERTLDVVGDGLTTTVPVGDVLMINCEEVPPTPTQGPSEPTATPVLPGLGYGGDQAPGRAPGSWLIVGMLASAAAILGLSGWRVARRRPS